MALNFAENKSQGVPSANAYSESSKRRRQSVFAKIVNYSQWLAVFAKKAPSGMFN